MTLKEKSTKVMARIIIERVLEGLIDEGISERLFYKLLETESGEQCPVYQGLSKHGYGAILCHYIPEKAVEKILAECGQIFDRLCFSITDNQSKKTIERRLADLSEVQEHREKFIEAMAYVATRQLLIGLFLKLTWAIEENFEESLLFAEKYQYSLLAEEIWGEGLTHTGVFSRPSIEVMAQKAAKKRREHLTGLLRTLPELIVNPKGRHPKLAMSKIRSAIMKRGSTDASRKGVAYDLGVSAKALDDWRKEHGFPNWKAVVNYVTKGGSN